MKLESSPIERDLEVLVSGKLNVSQQWALVAGMANHILGHIKYSISSWLREGIISLYTSQVQHLLEYCVQVWTLKHQKSITFLHCIKRKGPRW